MLDISPRHTLTPNGTRVERSGPFLARGFRLTREVRAGGPAAPHETVRVLTLDGERTVALWTRWPDRTSAIVGHYRDRGEDTLHGVELEDLLAYARERWPVR